MADDEVKRVRKEVHKLVREMANDPDPKVRARAKAAMRAGHRLLTKLAKQRGMGGI